MPYDNAITEVVVGITGVPIPANTNIRTKLSALGVTEENLPEIWWAIECRFDVNTNLADLSPNMKVGEVWDYWKAKIAEDPDNNPEVP